MQHILTHLERPVCFHKNNLDFNVYSLENIYRCAFQMSPSMHATCSCGWGGS